MEAESEHGRRGAVGEFPFGEDTAYADLGRKAATYTIKARFVENDHVAASAALIAAVESPGAGPLMHPTRGLIMAACTSLKVRDDIIEEQGVTYADMEFTEANEWPGGLSLGGGILGAVADALFAAADIVFLANYVVGLVPFHREAAVTGTTAGVIGTIAHEFGRATRGATDSRTVRALMDLEAVAVDPVLLKTPKVVLSAIRGGIGAIARRLPAADGFQAMRRIVNSAASSSLLNGPAGVAQNAVYTLTRVVAGAYMAQAALAQRYTNSQEAANALDAARTVFVDESRIAYEQCQNELFLELRKYTTVVQTQMYSKIYVLPGVVIFDFSGGTHPLVAAYAIYGDAREHRRLEQGNVLNASGRFGHNVIGTSA